MKIVIPNDYAAAMPRLARHAPLASPEVGRYRKPSADLAGSARGLNTADPIVPVHSRSASRAS